MPTSATGTSSSGSRPGPAGRRAAEARRAAACAAAGFTLLEVLVVVVIIGIIASMAVVSVSVLGGDHEMDREAARLAAVLGQAREEAMLQGRDVGMRVDTRGYDFLLYDTRNERWVLASADPLLRERTLPEGLGLELRLESSNVQLRARAAADPSVPPAPQVVVQASGDLAPFEILLRREGTDEVRRVAGGADGTITAGKVDERARG